MMMSSNSIFIIRHFFLFYKLYTFQNQNSENGCLFPNMFQKNSKTKKLYVKIGQINKTCKLKKKNCTNQTAEEITHQSSSQSKNL